MVGQGRYVVDHRCPIINEETIGRKVMKLGYKNHERCNKKIIQFGLMLIISSQVGGGR